MQSSDQDPRPAPAGAPRGKEPERPERRRLDPADASPPSGKTSGWTWGAKGDGDGGHAPPRRKRAFRSKAPAHDGWNATQLRGALTTEAGLTPNSPLFGQHRQRVLYPPRRQPPHDGLPRSGPGFAPGRRR